MNEKAQVQSSGLFELQHGRQINEGDFVNGIKVVRVTNQFAFLEKQKGEAFGKALNRMYDSACRFIVTTDRQPLDLSAATLKGIREG